MTSPTAIKLHYGRELKAVRRLRYSEEKSSLSDSSFPPSASHLSQYRKALLQSSSDRVTYSAQKDHHLCYAPPEKSPSIVC